MNEIYAAIIGAIVGFIGTYCVSVKLFNKQRAHEAASKFREVLSDPILKCKSTDDGFEIKAVLLQSALKIEKAVILYEPFIEKIKIPEFQKAWNKYCESVNYSNINDMAPETGVGMEGYIRELSEKEQREKILSLLYKLISYAPVK